MDEYLGKIRLLREKLQIEAKKTELEELKKASMAADFWQNQDNAQKVSARMALISRVIDDISALEAKIQGILDLEQMRKDFDTEMEKDFENELKEFEKTYNNLEFKTFLSGKYDSAGAIIAIHAGQGGTEACDWVEMLFRMYSMYAEKKGWKIEMNDLVRGTEAGISRVNFEVHGDYAYGMLKNETGTHRLVRISPFNAQGLRQTSFAGIEVLPIIDNDIEIDIKPEDIIFSTSRAGGPGGQNVNKVNSKVTIVHRFTGIQIQCAVERSQQQNRERAMRMLRAKLYQIELEKQMAEEARLKGEHKTFGWGNQIRNYVLQPYKLVKDLRTDVESSDPDSILDGNLDEFIEAEIKL